MALAFTANDFAPVGIVDGGVYDIGTTAGASTISLPTTPPDGISATFVALVTGILVFQRAEKNFIDVA
jgi:hypothetical protein